MKIYTNVSHYNRENRGELFDLLKLLWKPGKRQHYKKIVEKYFITDNPEEANIFILPMSWNYYYKNNLLFLADQFINQLKNYNRPIVTFVTGDFGVTPEVKDVYVFRASGYQSTRLIHQHAFPIFISDPLLKFFNTTSPIIRKKGEKPVIGFCGQAETNQLKNIHDYFKTSYRNIRYRMGLSLIEPQETYPSTLRRAKCLTILEASKDINTNFIKRKIYRDGAITPQNKFKSRLEFFNNMSTSDYILCVRGAGNFSVRFYETLALGRIPVFINTDCILPLDTLIDWKKYVVWVEEDEIKYLPEKILNFHQSLNSSDFYNLQIACRQLWETHLSINGYFNQWPKLFKNEVGEDIKIG